MPERYPDPEHEPATRGELRRLGQELRGDIKELRTELVEMIDRQVSQLRGEMKEMRGEMARADVMEEQHKNLRLEQRLWLFTLVFVVSGGLDQVYQWVSGLLKGL